MSSATRHWSPAAFCDNFSICMLELVDRVVCRRELRRDGGGILRQSPTQLLVGKQPFESLGDSLCVHWHDDSGATVNVWRDSAAIADHNRGPRCHRLDDGIAVVL